VRNLIDKLPEYQEALAALQRGLSPLFITGATGSFRALLAASLWMQASDSAPAHPPDAIQAPSAPAPAHPPDATQTPPAPGAPRSPRGGGALLVVAPGVDQVGAWQHDLEHLLPDHRVLLFEPAEALPFEVVAASREPTAGRLQVLAALRETVEGGAPPPVIVAPAEALLPRLLPPQVWEQAALFLATGAEYDLGALPERLVAAGYERIDLVSVPGQFALRGSILDIFPFQGPPVRLEFWGDEIASIRELDAASQRSGAVLERVAVWPAREFIYDRSLAAAAADRIRDAYRASPVLRSGTRRAPGREQLKGSRSAGVRLSQRLTRFLEMAEEGVGGSLNLVQPYFYPEQVSLISWLPEGSLVVIDEPARFQEQCRAHIALLESDYRRLFQEGQSFTPWQEYYLNEDELARDLAARPLIGLERLPGALRARPGRLEPQASVRLTVKEMQPFLARPDLLAPEVRGWLQRGMAVLLLAQTGERRERLEQNLRDHELAPLAAGDWPLRLKAGRLQVGVGQLEQGFEVPGLLAVVTGDELYGRKRVRSRAPGARPGHWMGAPGRAGEARGAGYPPAAELAPGDYVVHINHGIGRYLGIREMTVDGRTRDYLEIAYAAADRLYVPVDQVGIVQKYAGPEGAAPKLSRLGGSDWARLKQRVKKRVRELAVDLVALYSERMQRPGHAFPPDTVWQREFEAAFPYTETPDQLRAIEEVKADMERPRPMDRLICGDVGFGKTEVALRAAFKAVQDGKQVAVLAPTTVLAQQHEHTFKERFARYPVRIEVLSRFRSPRQQKETVDGLRRGLIDVVIGTHRLLSEDVEFKDLGLLVIDEEQRFGVNHKERIKLLKTNVDVLTLTATPIPRTLQLSLSGARDMSVIETPPEERMPVQTYVLEYQPDVIRDAIIREIRRGGQVFYLHNRVQSIDRVLLYLERLVPEASFRIAHGQMKEEDLEEVMLDFLNRKFDVLVCTTIIENGLDLPNVNTLVVERADTFGLAQLYQLRGRVGRSNRLAYGYFTIPENMMLTEQAEKRLRALQEFTEFGSGFKLALRDLEIRGAGNILGAEQHGHMAALGFDLYNQLLGEAVQELKGEPVPERRVAMPAWELQYGEAFIPDTYVADGRQKVEIYRRLAAAESLPEVEELAAELRDRFGPPPPPVTHLLGMARLRLRARELHIQDVQHSDHTLVLRFGREGAPRGSALARWGRVFDRRISFSAVGDLEVRIETSGLTPERLIGMLDQAISEV
jgi:transcription-repair coupling factor (superfamily II helicase)